MERRDARAPYRTYKNLLGKIHHKNKVLAMPSGDRVYLLADMHLKPLDAASRSAREQAVADNERLARFLAAIEGQGGMLILLGDTFNFWFERRSKVVGDYYAALNLFRLAADRGLAIHHVSGNRDFVVGEGLGFDPATRYPGFLRLRRGFTVSRMADFGIEPHGPRYRFHQAGKTISCLHGDSLCGRDRMFMALRWLLQGPIGRGVIRWAPWAALELLAASRQDRPNRRGAGQNPEETLDPETVRREVLMGGDVVVCGHLHSRVRREVAAVARNGVLEVIPAWMDGWYGILENGEVRVEEFR